MRNGWKCAEGLLLSLLLVLGISSVSWASETKQRVYDDAGLWTEEEEIQLEEAAAQVRANTHMDVVLVTTEDTEGKTSQEYADDFYDYGGFGEGKEASGVLFLIDLEHGELTCSTSGDMILLLTDERIHQMLGEGIEYAAAGDFKGAADSLLESTLYYYEKGIQSNQYLYDEETGQITVYRSIRWYEAVFAAGIAFAAAYSVCAGVKTQYAMKKNRMSAANFNKAYTADCQFSYGDQEDQLVNQFVTHVVIPRAHVSRSGSGGGRSSSGRSTVHRSSSGRRHGGGSRRFR